MTDIQIIAIIFASVPVLTIGGLFLNHLYFNSGKNSFKRKLPVDQILKDREQELMCNQINIMYNSMSEEEKDFFWNRKNSPTSYPNDIFKHNTCLTKFNLKP